MAISTGSLTVPQLGQNLDASIYGSQNAPKSMTIADMLDISNKNLELQKRSTLLPSEIEAGQATARKATTEANKAQFGFTNEQGIVAQNEAARLLKDPRIKDAQNTPEGREKALRALDEVGSTLKTKGLHDDVIKGMLGQYYTQAIHDPMQIAPKIDQGLSAATGSATQRQQLTPQYTTNAAGQIVGLTPGTNQISAPNEAPQGQPQGQPQGGAPGQVQNQFIQRQSLNPGAAQAGVINTAAQNLSTDFTATQQAASGAEPRIALFQNIKKLAPEAFTGVGGQRKELASGIAQAIGLDIYQTEKMSTDELAKTSAMLSLAGGNTDMARQLAEAANPNKKMNEQAIKQIADQMIGMEKLNQAKYKFLAPVANNPQAYQEKLAQFNRVNDFHIFQETTPEEVAKLKRSMSPDQQRAMGEKIKLARQLGLI
jgi:hypothetical protein